MKKTLLRILVLIQCFALVADPSFATLAKSSQAPISARLSLGNSNQAIQTFDREALVEPARWSGARIIVERLHTLFDVTRIKLTTPIMSRPLRELRLRWPLRWEEIHVFDVVNHGSMSNPFRSLPRWQSPIYFAEAQNPSGSNLKLTAELGALSRTELSRTLKVTKAFIRKAFAVGEDESAIFDLESSLIIDLPMLAEPNSVHLKKGVFADLLSLLADDLLVDTNEAVKMLNRGKGALIEIPLELSALHQLINSDDERRFYIFQNGQRHFAILLPNSKNNPDSVDLHAVFSADANAIGHSHPRFTDAEPSDQDEGVLRSDLYGRQYFIAVLKDPTGAIQLSRSRGPLYPSELEGADADRALQQLGIVKQRRNPLPTGGASDREDSAEGIRRQMLRNRLAHVPAGTRVPSLSNEFLDALINAEEAASGSHVQEIISTVTPVKDLESKSAAAIAQATFESHQLLAQQGDPLKTSMLAYVMAELNQNRPVQIFSPRFGQGTVTKMSGDDRFVVTFGAETKTLILKVPPFAITGNRFLWQRGSELRKQSDVIRRAQKANAADEQRLQRYLGSQFSIENWRSQLSPDAFRSLVSRLASVWDYYHFHENHPTDAQQFGGISVRLFAAASNGMESLRKAHEYESELLLNDHEKTSRRQIKALVERHEELAALGESFLEEHAAALVDLESSHSQVQGKYLDFSPSLYALFQYVLPSLNVNAELNEHFDRFIANLYDLVEQHQWSHSDIDSDFLAGYGHELIDRYGILGIAEYGDALAKTMDAFGRRFGERGEDVLAQLLNELEPVITRDGARPVLEMLTGLVQEFELGPDEAEMFADLLPHISLSVETLPSILKRTQELSQNHFLPLPALINSTLTPDELRERIKRIQDGGFNLQDDVDVDLNYTLLRAEIRQTRPVSPRESYGEFIRMVQEVRRGQYSPGQSAIAGDMLRQVRGMVYEAYLVRRKILDWEKRAKVLGRELIVVENLSYGAVVTSPITEERDGRKFIVGTDIPVWSTKIGSTESHNNEEIMRRDLFSDQQMSYLRDKEPLVVVVDASTSINDPTRTSPHIPDGFKGYRNHFIALNAQMGFSFSPGDFAVTEDFSDGLAKTPIYRNIVGKPTAADASKHPYKMYFYYPGERILYLRDHKKPSVIAPKLRDDTALTGPSVIIVQAAIEPDAVPVKVKDQFVGGNHTPAFFDDKDHYKQFYMDYEPGYGFHVTRSYILRSRREYQELLKVLGEDSISEVSSSLMPDVDRNIDTVVLDLDGTIAKTDQPLSDRAIVILADLLAKGKRIIIATEDIEKKVDKRVIQLILKVSQTSPGSLKNLWFATDGATVAYRFLSPTRKAKLEQYNSLSQIDREDRELLLNLLDSRFRGQFQIDTRAERISPDHRIDLREVKDRDKFIEELNGLLAANGLTYLAYKTGSTSVKIVRKHKADVVQYLIAGQGLRESNMLIVGDSARTNQIDRRMLSEFQDAVSINVGKPSRSIGMLNPKIVQMESGIDGTLRTLEALIQNGKLPMRPLLPYQTVYERSTYDNGEQEQVRHEEAVVFNSNGAYQLEKLLSQHALVESIISFAMGVVLTWGALGAIGVHSVISLVVSTLPVGYLSFRRLIDNPEVLLWKLKMRFIPHLYNIRASA